MHRIALTGLLLLSLLAAGCASQRVEVVKAPRNADATQIAPGLYIVAGYTAPQSRENFAGAWMMFHRHADELFGAGQYDVILSKEFAHNPLGGIQPPLISMAHGFVLSRTSPLSREEALKLARAYIGNNAGLLGMEEGPKPAR